MCSIDSIAVGRKTTNMLVKRVVFGIGLSLAQALVSAQEGTLRVANNPEGGAHFRDRVP